MVNANGLLGNIAYLFTSAELKRNPGLQSMLDGGQSFESQTSVSQAIRSLLNDDASRRVPLNLRAQLAEIGVESTERVIIDGLPPGGSLSSASLGIT